MISAKLIKMIEDHAEQIARELVNDIKTNPKTKSYHHFSAEEIHRRVYDVYRNLSDWLIDKTESEIQQSYMALGKERFEEKIPISQVIFSLVLTRNHLVEYVKRHGLADTALEFFMELELLFLVTKFYDKAIYYTVCGYEERQTKGSRQ